MPIKMNCPLRLRRRHPGRVAGRRGIRLLAVLMVAGTLPSLSSTACAQKASFADLLARAQAEIRAGHQWSPQGDNVAETFMTMMDRLPEATPAQLAEFQAMLQAQQKELAQSLNHVEHPPAGDHRAEDSTPQRQAAAGDETPGGGTPVDPHADGPVGAAGPAPSTRPPAVDGAGRGVAAEMRNQAAGPVLASREMPPAMTGQAMTGLAPAPGRSDQQAGPVSPPPAPPVPAQPTAMAQEFYRLGQAAEARGDISGARRYYETAAEQGLGAAALALGRLYDPAYVHRTVIGGISADPAAARRWYQRAASLGEARAQPLLQNLSAR